MARTKQNIVEFRNYSFSPDFPVIVLTGENWRISPVRSERLHFHNCVEIGICHEGCGSMVLPNGTVSFAAGTITCINRNVPHTTFSAQGTRSLWSYIFFDADLLLQGIVHQYYLSSLPSHLILPADTADILKPIVHQILDESNALQSGYQLVIQSLCAQLIVQLQRSQIIPSETTTEKSSVMIAPALDYIRTEYSQNFPMDYLAELCHLSPTHFRRLFRDLTGLPPIAFISRTRIIESCALLRTSGKSIAEIAGMVGFTTLSSYNRHFAEMMGCSPREWRKSINAPSRHAVVGLAGWTEAEE